jgi:hypothetical protein
VAWRRGTAAQVVAAPRDTKGWPIRPAPIAAQVGRDVVGPQQIICAKPTARGVCPGAGRALYSDRHAVIGDAERTALEV